MTSREFQIRYWLDVGIVFALFLFVIGGIYRWTKGAQAQEEQKIQVRIFNPYYPDIGLQVKCDWNNEKKTFNFQRIYLLKGKGDLSVRVPASVRKCEIWPKIGKFDEKGKRNAH